MTTFLDDEASIEDSKPREGFHIFTGLKTYRLASADRDVDIGGITYFASPIVRSAVGISSTTGAKTLTVMLPVSHELPQRYLQGGVPPRSVSVVVWRKQVRSGLAERIWQGSVTSMSIDAHVAKLQVPSRIGEHMLRRLPTITAGRGCPHVLYGPGCLQSDTSFTVVTSASTVDGSTIEVASMAGHPDQWAQFGDLTHVASGESMTIFDQTGTTLKIQLPIVGMVDGDEVRVRAGCKHDIVDCHVKFDNRHHMGGFPQLPRSNPHLPTGFGIYQTA